MKGTVCGVALLCLAAVLSFGGAPAASGAAPRGVSVDIEIAFDTTGSMASSLDRARQDALSILNGVRAVVPGARFAVVSFRDHGNPGGEYETLQPMTTNTTALQAALSRLKAVSNPSPSNLTVESYNLAFHRSYSDPALGWRTASRKVVLVIGDAEPYGGGAAGIGGCRDDHVDPDGLNVRTELAGMRAAKRTLVMIRAESPNTTASLDCYSSLVGLTYPGGAARNASDADLATPIVSLLRSTVAPILIQPSFPFVLPGRSTSVKLILSNPNAAVLQVKKLSVQLPAGFVIQSTSPRATASGGHVTWPGGMSLQPNAGATMRITVRAGAKPLHGTVRSNGSFQLANGAAFTSSASASLPVTRSVAVRLSSSKHGAKLTGSATITYPSAAVTPVRASGLRVRGSFTLAPGSARKLVLRPVAYRLALARGNGTATFTLRVTSARNVTACHAGSRGTLTVTDHGFGALAGNATARLTLPKACGATTTWPGRAGAIRPT